MPELVDAVLLAATLRPARWTAETLAEDLGLDVEEVEAAIKVLRERKHIQKRRGSPKWGGKDRIRCTMAGEELCIAELRAQILEEEPSPD